MALWRQVVAVLQQMRPISERLELVFPSPYYSTKPLSENTFNSAMARMGYKYLATAHGFRALLSTVANEAGWRSDVIERQLAQPGVGRQPTQHLYGRAHPAHVMVG